ncbi:hypothetical protein HUA78_30450 [Myxococcus sp. CA033]|uniref:hypothetical protein n=1 Tax=Myxococcus sp. CA033 TaxID=2741516 RepID=UPI00157B36D1|nr:hypothetical protein [Myxococcus sp. CA033]NTX38774.1 hypothetical protein [Myxococcus sp. CA033]
MSDKRARLLTPLEFAQLSKAKDFNPRAALVARDVGEVPHPRVEGGVLHDVIMSMSTVGRADDTVSQGGWDLVNFLKTPVLLWCHDMWSPPIGTIGAPVVRTTETGMQQLVAPTVEFAPREVNPFGAMVGALYTREKRFSRAFSVGVRPKLWNYNDERGGVDFMHQELLELSCCAIGMNQECLSGAKSAGIQVDLFLPFAEKRLDNDATAPAWMAQDFAGTVYHTLVGTRAAPGRVVLRLKRRQQAQAPATHLMGARPGQACAPGGLKRPVHRQGASLGQPRLRPSSAPLHPPSPSTAPPSLLCAGAGSDSRVARLGSEPPQCSRTAASRVPGDSGDGLASPDERNEDPLQFTGAGLRPRGWTDGYLPPASTSPRLTAGAGTGTSSWSGNWRVQTRQIIDAISQNDMIAMTVTAWLGFSDFNIRNTASMGFI